MRLASAADRKDKLTDIISNMSGPHIRRSLLLRYRALVLTNTPTQLYAVQSVDFRIVEIYSMARRKRV
jgi:hypothetical protein